MIDIQQINGKFDETQNETKELIMEIVANFHHRNGRKNEDGSMGTISISPKQFNDCLAFMARAKEII